MDGDEALEIALTDGSVVDGDTRTVEWYQPTGFGIFLESADLEGDGVDELFAVRWAGSSSTVEAWSVAGRNLLWSLTVAARLGPPRLHQLDGDPALELVIGEWEWPDVMIFDTATLELEDEIEGSIWAVRNLVVGNLDRDPQAEILWGAGRTNGGESALFLADADPLAVRWQSRDDAAPYSGPFAGHVTVAFRPEIVAVSRGRPQAGYRGRVQVFDGWTLKETAVSDPALTPTNSGLRAATLVDLDGDGRDEILVAGELRPDIPRPPSDHPPITCRNTTEPVRLGDRVGMRYWLVLRGEREVTYLPEKVGVMC